MKKNITMTTDQKSKLIYGILSSMKFQAKNENKAFNEGDNFFRLCFLGDHELIHIAKLLGV